MSNKEIRGSGARTNPNPKPPTSFNGSSGGRSNPHPIPSPNTGKKK